MENDQQVLPKQLVIICPNSLINIPRNRAQTVDDITQI